MNQVLLGVEKGWESLRVGDKFRTPDNAKGVDFTISKIESNRIVISPQKISINRKAFEAAIDYLHENNHNARNRCEIMSNNDRKKAGPLCQASRDKNNNTRCINYILPILKSKGLVDFSGDRPNKVWLINENETS